MKRRCLTFLSLVIACVSSIAANRVAADEIPRIDQRFANESTTETPDFRKDVVPLLGKLGCNGRACHGAFQGQGGLRLSLFGYDFKADHDMLTAGDAPRVQCEQPDLSLMLRKPLMAEPHEGGQRFEADSWQHRVLRRWIADGARPVTSTSAEFVRLDVTPTEIVTAEHAATRPLKAVAVWSDGEHVDVTPLCRFQTNNDQVATVDDAGVVTVTGPGDTHIVVFYDNGVVPISVIQPVSDQVGEHYPAVPTPTRVDELVVQKLRKLGMVPSDLCGDAEFLRRVSLDLTGTLPTATEVETFVADTSLPWDQKRSRKIEELLERPAYAAWWATRFADWTGNNVTKLNSNRSGVDPATRATEWYEWLRVRIEKNVPYDQLAEGIVLAVSRSGGESYKDYCQRMSGYHHLDASAHYADQPSLTHYWSRREFQKPEERALGFAYTFLGIRIQCAQCHKHPFDQWTKDDFDRFQGFFARLRYGSAPGTKADEQELLQQMGIDNKKLKGNELGRALRTHLNKGDVIPFDELFIPPVNRRARQAANQKPDKQKAQLVIGRTAKILGGEEVTIEDLADPRQALMEWLRDESNPYFTKAIVNRVWSGYFNVGIVEPADDLSLANPPSNEPLLDYLATEFRQHGYDLKWLHRTIANSRTYQLSWKPNSTNEFDERNFARAVPRRLPAEVAVDALQRATMSDTESAKWSDSVKGRAIANATAGGRIQRGREDYALGLFGRSTRESNCECDRSLEPNLLQTVYLRNDDEVLGLINGKGRWVEQIVPGPADANTPPGKRPGQRLSQLKPQQLQRRLDAAKQNGRDKAVRAIEAELARRANGGEMEPTDESGSSPQTSPAELTRIVRQAYLRTLSRYPTANELERTLHYYDEAGDLTAGTRDLVWALVNTKEFLLNH